jgi:hypothetical protein
MLKWKFSKYNLTTRTTRSTEFLSTAYGNPAINVNNTLLKEGVISPLRSAAKPAEQQPQLGLLGPVKTRVGDELAPVQILTAGDAGLAEAGCPGPMRHRKQAAA